jgi:hypothetical protein
MNLILINNAQRDVKRSLFVGISVNKIVIKIVLNINVKNLFKDNYLVDI